MEDQPARKPVDEYLRPRCRCIDGHRPGHTHAAPDSMAAPHVDVSVPAFGGSIRLSSASGGLESLWIRLRAPDGAGVIVDHARQEYAQPAVRLTPRDARTLSNLLRRYADTHRDTEE